VEKRLALREQELTKQIQEETSKATAQQLEALQQSLQSKDAAMDEARTRELALLKEKAELEEKRKDMELDYQRKLTEERQQLEKQLIEKYATEADLKLKERDKQIEDLRKSLAEARGETQKRTGIDGNPGRGPGAGPGSQPEQPFSA
jgi:HD superfamily phosphohydrolase